MYQYDVEIHTVSYTVPYVCFLSFIKVALLKIVQNSFFFDKINHDLTSLFEKLFDSKS